LTIALGHGSIFPPLLEQDQQECHTNAKQRNQVENIPKGQHRAKKNPATRIYCHHAAIFAKDMTLICGIDFGSSLIKATSNGHEFIAPAMLGEYNEGWSGMGTDTAWESNLIVYTSIGDDGTPVREFFGELARTQSEVKRVLTKGGRIAEIGDVALAINVALAVLAIKNGLIDESSQDPQQVDCIATVGVPVSTTLEKMKQLSATLKGAKNVILENEYTHQILQIDLNITNCIIIYGPYGSYFQVMQEFGENEAVDAVVTDIGFGSAEILSIYEGKPNMLSSGSIVDLSLETLANRVAIALNKQTGKVVRGIDLMRLLQDAKKTVVLGGETLDISKIVKYYIEAIATSLTDEIIQLVSKLPPDARLKYFIFTGDGVDLFWKDLEVILYTKNLIQDINQAAHPKDYRIANAKGFEAIATQRASKQSSTE
jgi:hypothetical protein